LTATNRNTHIQQPPPHATLVYINYLYSKEAKKKQKQLQVIYNVKIASNVLCFMQNYNNRNKQTNS